MATVQPLKDIFDREIAENLTPQNVLLVAPQWPAAMGPAVAGVVDDTHYTTPQAAILAAIAIGGTAALPITILVYGGTYANAIALPPLGFINIKAAGSPAPTPIDDVIFSGAITWAPSAVGAPMIGMSGIRCTHASGIVATGANTLANLTLAACSSPVVTATGGVAVRGLLGTSLGVFSTLAGSNSLMASGSSASTTVVDGISSLSIMPGCNIAGTLAVTAGALCSAQGGSNISGNITVGATGSALDIRGSRAPGTYTVNAAGTMERSIDTQAVATINGTQAVAFTNKYLTAPLAVVFEQLTGTAEMPKVTNLTATGFDITGTGVATYTAVMIQK